MVGCPLAFLIFAIDIGNVSCYAALGCVRLGEPGGVSVILCFLGISSPCMPLGSTTQKFTTFLEGFAMAMPSAATVAKNWQNGMANSGEKLKQGIMSVQVAPTQKAAQRIDAMVAGVIRAAQSGKTQAALNAVSLQDWQKAMIDKGLGRVAAGASSAVPKFQRFMDKFLPHLQQGLDALASNPRGDLEQNIGRMVQMARHNSTFKLNG